MLNEYNAFLANQTWDLALTSSEHNIVGCKWVFRIKRSPDDTVEWNKACLIAKGFHQWPAIYYFDTFSPIVKPATIWTVLSLALMKNWSIRHMDVKNTFIHGTLSEQIFLSQPLSFVNSVYPSHVCKLKKAICGLKEAPWAWFTKLCNFLEHYGSNHSQFDTLFNLYPFGFQWNILGSWSIFLALKSSLHQRAYFLLNASIL